MLDLLELDPELRLGQQQLQTGLQADWGGLLISDGNREASEKPGLVGPPQAWVWAPLLAVSSPYQVLPPCSCEAVVAMLVRCSDEWQPCH